MAVINRVAWGEFLKSHPEAHLLQSGEWGDFKSQFGWSAQYVQTGDSGAQILFRHLPLNYSVAYIPKGPIGDNWNRVIQQVFSLCKEKHAIVLYVEPDRWENDPKNQNILSGGLRVSDISIQPRKTIVISLLGPEEEWLKRMKQKTRYNIRLAQKNDVYVEKTGDVRVFNQLIKRTGERSDFGVHNPEYYEKVYERFSANQKCCLMIAKYEEIPLAGLIVFKQGKRAWYLYGASNEQERQRMPAYLLQWEAMRWAAGEGCVEYDLWGVPDEPEDYLEENFTKRSDGLWGVYRFKRGFGGKLCRSAGVYERSLNSPIHRLFNLAIKTRKGSLS